MFFMAVTDNCLEDVRLCTLVDMNQYFGGTSASTFRVEE
jgi:hypothetical protein